MKRIILGTILFSLIFSGCNSNGEDENNVDPTQTDPSSDQLPYEDDTTDVIGSTVYLLQKSETDSNMDGSADEKTTYTYNTNHDKKMVQTVTIENGTETVEETERYNYDSQNRLTSKATYDADGKITDSYQIFYTDGYISKTIDTSSYIYSEFLYTTTYDANGNELTYEYKYVFDGTYTDSYEHYLKTYHYNDTDKPTNTVYQSISEDGTKGEEIIVERYTYDDQGRLATWQYDYDQNGIFDYSEYDYEYDSNGNVLKYYYDDETTVNNYETYEYNSAGKMTRRAAFDNSGTLISETLVTYDAGSGKLLSWSYDRDADGTFDSTYTYEYNAQGKLTAETDYWRASSSGTEYYDYYTYEYDENGLLIGETYSENPQGITESETWHTWVTAN